MCFCKQFWTEIRLLPILIGNYPQMVFALEILTDTEYEYAIFMSGRSLFPRLYQYDDKHLIRYSYTRCCFYCDLCFERGQSYLGAIYTIDTTLVFGISDQIRHKPGCTTTKDDTRLSDLGNIFAAKTKALISCAVTTQLICAMQKNNNSFSHCVIHMLIRKNTHKRI